MPRASILAKCLNSRNANRLREQSYFRPDWDARQLDIFFPAMVGVSFPKPACPASATTKKQENGTLAHQRAKDTEAAPRVPARLRDPLFGVPVGLVGVNYEMRL